MPNERPHVTSCVVNSNVYIICHHLRDIRSRNVHNFDLDLLNGLMSNINMPMERRHMTLYLLAIAMFALSVTVYEILKIEMCIGLILTFRKVQGQM